MAGITPEKYQAYIRGEISRAEAEKPVAPSAPVAPVSSSPKPTSSMTDWANIDGVFNRGPSSSPGSTNQTPSAPQFSAPSTPLMLPGGAWGGQPTVIGTQVLPTFMTAPQTAQKAAPQRFTPPPIDTDGITNRIRSKYMTDLDNTVSGLRQELAKATQAGDLAVTQNNTALNDRIKQLVQEQNVQNDQAATLQNRRGGFYSGGLDYQRGQISTATGQAKESVTRDITQRNADIYAKNQLLASQAYENIERLKTQAPQRIQELVQEAIMQERMFALQEGALTGEYNGRNTLAAQNQQFNQGIAVGELTGNYNPYATDIATMNANSKAWFNASPEEKLRLEQENKTIGSKIGARKDSNGDWIMPSSNRTLSGQNADLAREKFQYDQEQFDFEKQYRINRANAEDQKWLAEYEREGQQFASRQGLEWAQLNQRQQEFVADQAYKYKALEMSVQKTDDKELQGLYAGLSSGKINAFDANREVDLQLKNGLINQDSAAKMKSLIQQYAESTQPVSKETGYKFQTSPNSELTSMSMEQLAKAWETDPTGKAAGRPLYDWRSWIMDAKNGFGAGVSFELWKSKYGPVLGGRRS